MTFHWPVALPQISWAHTLLSVHTVDNVVSLHWIKNTVDYLGPLYVHISIIVVSLSRLENTLDFLSVFSTWSSCSWCSWSSSPWPVPAWPSMKSSENSWPSPAGTSPVMRPASLSRPPPSAVDSRIRIGANTPPVPVWALGSVVPCSLGGIREVEIENVYVHVLVIYQLRFHNL